MSDRTCVIEGCDRPFLARGWCKKHYRAWKAHGTPIVIKPSAEERFMAKVEKSDGDDCWMWIGSYDKAGGYGKFWLGNTKTGAHRASYELFVGPIPPGMDIDHLCHSFECTEGVACSHRRCVNPAHLEPVTHRENMLRGRGWAGQQVRRTHCPRGHEYTDENTYVSPKGERSCRACRPMHNQRRKLRRRAA